TGGYVLSCPANLLPYLEQQALYAELFTTVTYSPSLLSTPSLVPDLLTPIPVFNCPGDPRGPLIQFTGKGYARSSICYGGVSGSKTDDAGANYYQGILQGTVNISTSNGLVSINATHPLVVGPYVRLTDVTDGTSNTLLLGEWVPLTPTAFSPLSSSPA